MASQLSQNSARQVISEFLNEFSQLAQCKTKDAETLNKFFDAKGVSRAEFCVSRLLKHSVVDQGKVLLTYLKNWSKLVPMALHPGQLNVRIFSKVLSVLHCDPLCSQLPIELVETLHEMILNLNVEYLVLMADKVRLMIANGELRNKRSVSFFIKIQEKLLGPGHKPTESDQMQWLGKLLDETNADSCESVVSVIRTLDLDSLLVLYASKTLDHCKTIDLGTAMKLVAVSPFVPSDILIQIYDRLCGDFESPDMDTLVGLIAVFAQMKGSFKQHPHTMTVFYKNIKKKPAYAWTTAFGLVTTLISMDVSNKQDMITKMLVAGFRTVWSFVQAMQHSLWIRKQVGTGSMNNIKTNLAKIIDCTKLDGTMVFSDLIGQSLDHILLGIVSEGSKTFSLRLADGTLDRTGDSIALFGRSVFVKLVMISNNPERLRSQLRHLMNMVFISVDSPNFESLCYILADILLDLVVSIPALMMNISLIFRELIQRVPDLSPRIADVLIRSILPLVNQKLELMDDLLKAAKISLASPDKVTTGVTLVVLLLKSITSRSTVRNVVSSSQSFASLSSQQLEDMGMKKRTDHQMALEVFGNVKRSISQSCHSRMLVYNTLADICRRSRCFVPHSIDLIVDHFEEFSQSRFKPASFIKVQGDRVSVTTPFVQLTRTFCILLRMGFNGGDDCNLTQNTSTMISDLFMRAEAMLNEFVDKVHLMKMEDLGVDKLSDFGNNSDGIKNKTFASMLLDLFDVLITHVYISSPEVTTHVSNVLVELSTRRKELTELIKEKKHQKAVTATTRKVNFKGDHEIITTPCSDLFELNEMMSTILGLGNEGDANIEDVREALFGWLLVRVFNQVDALDPFFNLAFCTQDTLAEMAKSLLTFYLGIRVPKAFQMLSMHDSLKTKALQSYCKLLKFLVQRYECRCQPSLDMLIKAVEGQRRPVLTQMNLSQASTQTNPQQLPYRHLLTKQLEIVLNKLLGDLLTNYNLFVQQKAVADFQKQARALLDLATFLCIDCVAVESGKLQKFALKSALRLVTIAEIDNEVVAKDLWTFLMSVWLTMDLRTDYVEMVKKMLKEVMVVVEAFEANVYHKSINYKTKNAVCTTCVLFCTRVFENCRTALMAREAIKVDHVDSMVASVCVLMTSAIEAVIIPSEHCMDTSDLCRDLLKAMTEMFVTTQLLAKIVQKRISNGNTRPDENPACTAFKAMLDLGVGPLIYQTFDKLGVFDNGFAAEAAANPERRERIKKARIRKNKINEKVFQRMEKESANLQKVLNSAYRTTKLSTFELDDSLFDHFRDFSFKKRALAAKLAGRDATFTEEFINADLDGNVNDVQPENVIRNSVELETESRDMVEVADE